LIAKDIWKNYLESLILSGNLPSLSKNTVLASKPVSLMHAETGRLK
jgi:hypothetical protein